MSKSLLFIKVTEDYPKEVVSQVTSIATLLGVIIDETQLTDLTEFEKEFCGKKEYDFIYLAAHGSHSCFGKIILT